MPRPWTPAISDAKYDVLIFVDGGIPALGQARPGGGMGRGRFGQPNPDAIPQEYRQMVGRITADKDDPSAQEIPGRRRGGPDDRRLDQPRLSSRPAHRQPPRGENGRRPGSARWQRKSSMFRARCSRSAWTTPIPWPSACPTPGRLLRQQPGLRPDCPTPALKGVQAVAWFENTNPLRSGWVWGDQYLRRGVEVIAAPVGKGKLFLFGPEITFRGQPHGTFKFLFNGILLRRERSG